MPSRETFSRSIENNFQAMASLVSEANAFGENLGMGPHSLYRLNFVLEEIISNVIKYAYQDDNIHLIHVQISHEGERVRITIADDGKAFDPLHSPEPNTGLPVEEREIGGLGIHLVRKMTQQMAYIRDNGNNILTIVFGTHESSE